MTKKWLEIQAKLKYEVDTLMGKGPIVLVGLLFFVTMLVVIIAGIIGALINKDLNTGNMIWLSLMHAIDAGTLAGDNTANVGFVVVMSLVTLCGIFVTSILIGIISTGFEQKLNELRKGKSKVIENNHKVIIGFNEGIYTLLKELIEAGANESRSCIVVLGEEDKTEMEELIKGHVEDFKTTRIVCKSGKLTESYLLERASLETCQSIIINQEDDFAVIKIILATVNYLKSKKAFHKESYITSMIYNKANVAAAKIAGEGKAEILYFKDALSRIIAHTCRQPGLSIVLTEFFDFAGDEFYFENFPELAGKSFGDILNLFEQSTVVGIEQNGQVKLNPPMETVLKAEDSVIHLASDNKVSKPMAQPGPVNKQIKVTQKVPAVINHPLVVLGYNHYLPDILVELDHYATKGTRITLAGTELESLDDKIQLQNIALNTVICDIYERSYLEQLLDDSIEDILILSDLTCSKEDADSKTLLLLIQLRDLGKKRNKPFNITSEMCLVSNQLLAKVANVNDFVVGSTITNLIIAQVSENRKLALLFEDLLDADGSELYMKKSNRYVPSGVEVDFFTLTAIAKQRNEIVVGYKKMTPKGIVVRTNVKKSEKITLSDEDYIILIAQDSQ